MRPYCKIRYGATSLVAKRNVEPRQHPSSSSHWIERLAKLGYAMWLVAHCFPRGTLEIRLDGRYEKPPQFYWIGTKEAEPSVPRTCGSGNCSTVPVLSYSYS
eukprot:scaffold1519_cov166-Amphora_coffeaeformis.AAC.17